MKMAKANLASMSVGSLLKLRDDIGNGSAVGPTSCSANFRG
jgi:hypothetical protein